MQITKSLAPLPLALGGRTEPRPGAAAENPHHFQRLLDQVNGLQKEADQQVKKTLLGQGDLHEAMLALEKANLSLKVLVQVRNKLIQAYEELSRTSM
uniref:Flagellar hook-basal body complex protein FliE n=1 Tax=Desulfobacca acetoxidans TaxID=60893 RepID=A0A7V4LCM3_9BACT